MAEIVLERGVSNADHTERVRAHAKRLGFPVVGIARADVPLDADVARYEAFIDAGMHGEMAWLAENRAVRARLDGEAILAGAKSVVCVAQAYDAAPRGDERVARYARGKDYHNALRKKLRRLAVFLRSLGTEERPVEARPMCDTAPVLERAWAARAGVGFVGKNGLLIAPGTGSFVLLGEVVTTLDLAPDAPMPERCGACTRCLDACPTKAFARPFVLDARRCVSYLTIELRSAIDDEALREGVGEHLFGCDDCQTVCPFNAGAVRPPAAGYTKPLAAWASLDTPSVLSHAVARPGEMPPGLESSPVKRATPEGLARNAATVLGNRRDGSPASRAALETASREHPSAVVRAAAAWALRRLDMR